MDDEQMLKRCDELIDDFCKNGIKARLWTMHIPAQPEKDPDLVFSVLIMRYKKLKQRNKELLILCQDLSSCINEK